MKPIMESWGKYLDEMYVRDTPPDIDVRAVPRAVKGFYEWYDSQDFTLRILVDLLMPIGGQLVDAREAVEAYKRWKEWYLLDEDDPLKYGPAAERLGNNGTSLLLDAILAVILAIPGFDILEGGGLAYKQVKKALGGGKVSKELRTLSRGAIKWTDADKPAAIAYMSILYAMDSPDEKPKLNKDGLPDKGDVPEEVINTWKKRRNEQARRINKALNKLEKYEAEMEAESEAERKRHDRAVKAGAKAGQKRYDADRRRGFKP